MRAAWWKESRTAQRMTNSNTKQVKCDEVEVENMSNKQLGSAQRKTSPSTFFIRLSGQKLWRLFPVAIE